MWFGNRQDSVVLDLDAPVLELKPFFGALHRRNCYVDVVWIILLRAVSLAGDATDVSSPMCIMLIKSDFSFLR